DVLVNNAGIGVAGPIEQVSIADSKALFETNYFGAIRTIRAVVPGMRSRRSGAIVNVTSVAGRIAIPIHGHYAATKFALEAVSESLAGEMQPFGVRVAIIEPGVILTPIFTKAESVIDPSTPYLTAIHRLWRFFAAQLVDPTMPAAVADTIVEAVETDTPRLRYVVGEDGAVLVAGRSKMADEAWIELNAEPDEDRFVAKALEAFGADLYNPPSMFSRMRSKRTQASAV
ncbi:MAG: SDR family NAD(P)-dependent oxidoreductase, partial [Bryobacteraceae bacterium]